MNWCLCVTLTETEAGTRQTSKMGSFTAKVNGWKVLNYRCKALHLRCFWWSWLRLCLNLNTKQKFNPTNIYLFKLNKRYTSKRCEICSKLTIKTPERRQWKLWKYFKPFSSAFTFDFDQVRLWPMESSILFAVIFWGIS